MTSEIDQRLSMVNMQAADLRIWHNQDVTFLQGWQKSQEKVMAELMINWRLCEPPAHIRYKGSQITIAPASELLYECKGSGTLLPLCKLLWKWFLVREPRDLGLQRVNFGPSGADWGSFWGFRNFAKMWPKKVHMTSGINFGLTLVNMQATDLRIWYNQDVTLLRGWQKSQEKVMTELMMN